MALKASAETAAKLCFRRDRVIGSLVSSIILLSHPRKEPLQLMELKDWQGPMVTEYRALLRFGHSGGVLVFVVTCPGAHKGFEISVKRGRKLDTNFDEKIAIST